MTNPEASMPSLPKRSLTCREVLDFLMAYLDGQLERGQHHEFERHLAACPSCVNYVNSYKATVAIGKAGMKDLGDAAAGTVPERLVHAIHEARLKSSGQP